MEPLNPDNEEDEIQDVNNIKHESNRDAVYVQTVNVVTNNDESHSMLAMENEHICYIDDCNEKGLQQCAGRNVRVNCVRWICDNHGVNAAKQHWCGGGGCGLREHDKYCETCAKKANKESWMKLALILGTIILIILILVFKS